MEIIVLLIEAVVGLFTKLLDACLLSKKINEEKMNKEQKTGRNGEMQEEKNERISEEKKVGERTGTGYVLGTIISILSGIIYCINRRLKVISPIAIC